MAWPKNKNKKSRVPESCESKIVPPWTQKALIGLASLLTTTNSITRRLCSDWDFLENALHILCSVVSYRHTWPDQEISLENTGKVLQFLTSSWNETEIFWYAYPKLCILPFTVYGPGDFFFFCSPGIYSRINKDFGIWQSKINLLTVQLTVNFINESFCASVLLSIKWT